MIWLRIDNPARQFISDASALPYLSAGEARHELLTSIGTLRSGVDGETPNMSVTLRNTSGECAKLFADDPPIGSRADLYDRSTIIFSGIVKRVALGESCTIEIDA